MFFSNACTVLARKRWHGAIISTRNAGTHGGHVAGCSKALRKSGLIHFERKSTAYTQTILRTRGAFSRPPMPIYSVGIAQVPSIDTPTIRRPGEMDAGLPLANSPRPRRIRKL